ncbi:ABC transporter permease [Actinokineospora sp. UTMC 2448]|uniref:ABC transporter permease n=1 Tax=Actinokineospora sp. UTMC 2448 TaxID=2268449 RepID=UPI002164D03A|nr:FtsX-like permease family protein [Actinokineospora sp. UTMC 2448]UVS79339.1 FtsX-like permease family protein [Actinokineospora sp. UTMC 2448]
MQLPWRSAPRAALSSPLTVLVAVVAALLLTFVGAAAVLHSDAAGNAAAGYQAGRLCPQSVAPVIDHRRVTAGEGAAVIDAAAAQAPRHGFPAPIGALYSPVRQWTWDSGLHPWSRFGWREGAMDNLTVLQGGSRDGLWVPRTVAEDGDVRLGDTVALPGFPRVTAIYEDLADPVGDYWCAEREEAVVNPLAPDGGAGALVLFPDRDSFVAAFDDIAGDSVTVSVRFPLERLPRTADEGADVAARGAAMLPAIEAMLPRPNMVITGNYFATPVEVSREAGDTVLGAVLPLTIVSLLVGLAGVAAVTVQWCQRRRAELRLLWARGAGPRALGGRAVLELAAPLLAGAVLGWLIARLALPWYAPSPYLSDGTAVVSALVATGVFAAALLVTGAVTVAHTHRAFQATGGRRRLWRGLRYLPWELATGVAAYLAWARLDATPVRMAFGQPLPEQPDAVGLAFPLLVVLTVALVAVRLVRWGLRAAHRLRWWRVPAAQLAVRRLAAAAGSAVGILLVGTLAVGTLTVGVGIATAQDDAFDTKSGLFVGAESSAQISTRVATETGLPPLLAAQTTLVGVLKSQDDVILAVDPATFATIAWVDGDRAELAARLARLDAPAAGALPTLRVGSAPDQRVRLPRIGDVEPVDHLPAFPLVGNRGYVVSTAAIPDPGDIDVWQIWSPKPVDLLLSDLDAAGLHHLHARGKSEALDGLPFLTVRWTFDFVTALGFVLAVVAAAALLLAVEVRRRQNALAGALATRMGLRPRTLVASHLLELGSLAGLSVAAGAAAGWACTAVASPMLDPSPWLRPVAAAPDLVGLVSTTLATALAVVALVCWSAVRSVTTARVGELIRG